MLGSYLVSYMYVLVIMYMATMVLANLAHEGNKLAKCTKAHVITGCCTLNFSVLNQTERTKPMFQWTSERFSLWKTGEIRKRAGHQN